MVITYRFLFAIVIEDKTDFLQCFFVAIELCLLDSEIIPELLWCLKRIALDRPRELEKP